ncbi:MAG TPA: SMI1/KNR4 family protein [Chitinophagaceae bacterium]|jgi:hypothetical protein|nr:SMI1/KNR4 family protein [Chitinophagaceae bacterium]
MPARLLQKMEEAETRLGVLFPEEIRSFLSGLPQAEVPFGEEEWLFGSFWDETGNYLVERSLDFRENWTLPGVIIAGNGIGDYLVLLPDAATGRLASTLYVLLHETAEIKVFADSLQQALEAGPLDYFWSGETLYSLDEEEKLVIGPRPSGEKDQPEAAPLSSDDEGDSGLRSAIDRWIDEEETGRWAQILEGLHQLTRSADPHHQAWAYYKLSDLYFKGFGPQPVHLEKALSYNEEAVRLKHHKSMANRAFCCLAGHGLEKDVNKAWELAHEANELSKQNSFIDIISGSKDKGAYESLLDRIRKEQGNQKKGKA